ncbi:hypothetical protein EW146_g7252 [Bondarzewia mesenterica]|uniref:Uncharacterized protein n=1 Tax=Bondarzewia mesenterica TaxID=1095465 RepID=A0A4S4LN57_9AGAM|nr:hypothetical protein EW146_g7252 [Bondarzewia mesenterica]
MSQRSLLSGGQLPLYSFFSIRNHKENLPPPKPAKRKRTDDNDIDRRPLNKDKESGGDTLILTDCFKETMTTSTPLLLSKTVRGLQTPLSFGDSRMAKKRPTSKSGTRAAPRAAHSPARHQPTRGASALPTPKSVSPPSPKRARLYRSPQSTSPRTPSPSRSSRQSKDVGSPPSPARSAHSLYPQYPLVFRRSTPESQRVLLVLRHAMSNSVCRYSRVLRPRRPPRPLSSSRFILPISAMIEMFLMLDERDQKEKDMYPETTSNSWKGEIVPSSQSQYLTIGLSPIRSGKSFTGHQPRAPGPKSDEIVPTSQSQELELVIPIAANRSLPDAQRLARRQLMSTFSQKGSEPSLMGSLLIPLPPHRPHGTPSRPSSGLVTSLAQITGPAVSQIWASSIDTSQTEPDTQALNYRPPSQPSPPTESNSRFLRSFESNVAVFDSSQTEPDSQAPTSCRPSQSDSSVKRDHEPSCPSSINDEPVIDSSQTQPDTQVPMYRHPSPPHPSSKSLSDVDSIPVASYDSSQTQPDTQALMYQAGAIPVASYDSSQTEPDTQAPIFRPPHYSLGKHLNEPFQPIPSNEGYIDSSQTEPDTQAPSYDHAPAPCSSVESNIRPLQCTPVNESAADSSQTEPDSQAPPYPPSRPPIVPADETPKRISFNGVPITSSMSDVGGKGKEKVIEPRFNRDRVKCNSGRHHAIPLGEIIEEPHDVSPPGLSSIRDQAAHVRGDDGPSSSKNTSSSKSTRYRISRKKVDMMVDFVEHGRGDQDTELDKFFNRNPPDATPSDPSDESYLSIPSTFNGVLDGLSQDRSYLNDDWVPHV